MAETTTLILNGGKVWQPVSTESCRVTVSDDCYYCISSTTPDGSQFGHRFDSNETQDIHVGAGQTLYFKCELQFRVTVTPSAMFLAASIFDDWFQAMTEGSRAFVIQNYIEANVKNGLQFYLRALYESVAVGTTVYLKFQTSTKPVIIKSRDVSFNGAAKLDYVAYEGGSHSGGTVLTPGNENRVNPVPTTVTLAFGGTGTGGVEYRRKRIYGSGQETGNASRLGTDVLGRETILKANTLYYVAMTNVAGVTGEIQLELSWFEGTPDIPS